jgi:UMF1 family MFS transporter
MRRPSWLTREVIGWTAFDFANQAFTMVIITALYQQYFIKQVVPMVDGSDARGKRLWEISNMSAELVIILLSPLVGALADFSGAKKKFLFITWIGCVAATLLLGLFGPGQYVGGMICFIIGYIFFGAGENFLNAFMPEIARQKDMGRVSAFSWSVAYSGALISMIVGSLILVAAGEGHLGYGLVALWCGVYFLVGGLPTFFLLRERKMKEAMPPGQTILTVGFHRLRETFREMRRYRQLLRFIVIAMIYLAGMSVVIYYAGTIARDVFGFSTGKQGIFFAQLIVTGIIGAAVIGRIQDRIGARATIQILLVIWTLTMLLAGFATREWIFWVTGNLAGLSMGALGSASRVMAGLFSPHHKAAEFFGFYGVAQKLSVILGLGLQMIVGLVAAKYGISNADAMRLGTAASAIFFIAGFLLLFTIDEREGRIIAIKAAREHVRQHRDYAGRIAGDVT